MKRNMVVVAVAQQEVAILYYPQNGGMIQSEKIDLAENTVDAVLQRVKQRVVDKNNFLCADVAEESLMLSPVDKHGVMENYIAEVRTNKEGRIDIALYSVNVLEHTMKNRIKEQDNIYRGSKIRDTEDDELRAPELEIGR